jgi:hypothetical protein
MNEAIMHSAMFQLNPSIPVVTADGKGEAIGWIDYGKDDELLWIVFLQKNGECWIYPNPQIRACPNITAGRLAGISTKELSKSIGGQTPCAEGKFKKTSSTEKLSSPARHFRNGHA